MIAFGEIAPLVRRPIILEPGAVYHGVAARSFGRGLFSKPDVRTEDLTWQQLFRIEAGDLVFSNIKAWEGAFAVAEEAHHGKVGSHRYLTCVPDRDRADGKFLGYYLQSPSGILALQAASPGSADRNRTLSTQRLAAIPVPLPPLDAQKRIVGRIDGAAEKVKQRSGHASAMRTEVNAMLQTAFTRVTAAVRLVRLGDIAPLVRRPVNIDPACIYKELGIRSFGRGTFHKAPVSGTELASKAVFSIEPGDLLLNIIFAWEGAVAIAQPEDEGRIGSHRFLTCVCDGTRTTADFLRFWLLSPDGLAQLGQASPGGAGRNRTLSQAGRANLLVPLPSLDAQKTFDILQAKAREALAAQAAATKQLDALMPAMLYEVFGDHTAIAAAA